jgi:hypothetical protein
LSKITRAGRAIARRKVARAATGGTLVECPWPLLARRAGAANIPSRLIAVPTRRALVETRVISIGRTIISLTARTIVRTLFECLRAARTFVAPLGSMLARRSRRWTRAALFVRSAVVASPPLLAKETLTARLVFMRWTFGSRLRRSRRAIAAHRFEAPRIA